MPEPINVLEQLRAGAPPPVGAFQFVGSEVLLSDEANAADAKTIKVHLKARTRDPIVHWYWGKVVHDFSTARLPSKIALDDSHAEEIGYARPELTEYGLELDGVVKLNAENPQHPSNRVAYNLRSGIPQEASISFVGNYDIVEVPQGLATQVNGKEFAGPGIIIQNWSLRACAICKCGADSTTQTTTLSEQAKGKLPTSVSTFGPASKKPEEAAMPESAVVVQPTQPEQQPIAPDGEQLAAPPAAEGVSVAPVASAAPVEEQQAGTPETQVSRAEFDALRQELEAATTRNTELAVQLQQLAGGAQPVPGKPMGEAAAKQLTWNEAKDKLRATNPGMNEAQLHAEACRLHPELVASVRIVKQAGAK